MRVSQISFPFMMLTMLSVLFIAGCDTREEKVEYVPPVQGDLLTNGRIAKISPEGAAEVKRMIEDIYFVNQYADMLGMFSDEEKDNISEHVEFRGAFEVTPRTDHYEVSFPDRTTIYPPEGEEEFESIEIFHKIGLRVRPTGDPSAFDIEFSAENKPIYAVMNTKDGREVEFMTFTFESGNEFKGLWHNDLQSFAQLTGSMLNAALQVYIPEEYRREFDGIDKFSVNFSDVIANAKLVPDDNNLWSGPYNSSMGKISIELPQDVGGVTILNFNTKQDIQKLNPAAYSEFFQAYDNLSESLYDVSENTVEDEAEIDMLPLLKSYKTLFTEGFDTYDFKMMLSDISVRLNKTPETAHTLKEFGIEEISVESFMSTIEDDKAKFDVSYAVKGIDIGLKQFEEEFGGATPQELVPENVSFGIGFENLPLASLADKSIALAEQAGNNNKQLESLFAQNSSEFINMLAEAETKIKINDSYIGNDVWLLLINGLGHVNPQSPVMMQGETEVRFYGMDYLMQIMDQRMKSEETAPPVRIMLQQYATGLGMMQMFGQQKKDDNGRDYRGYTLTLSPDGKVQMNGTDMSQMMGMMR